MGINLKSTLDKTLTTKLIQEAIDTGDIFKEYMPAIVFNEPQQVQFKLSEKDEELLTGELLLSGEDVDKILKEPGKTLPFYTFTLDIKGNTLEVKIDGKQLTNNEYKTAALVKGKVYDMLIDGDSKTIDSEETDDSEETKTTGDEVFVNIKDEKDFDEFNEDFKKLKNESSNLKALKLSRFAKNPSFRKALILNLINSKLSNIKVNGEPIAVNLKKLNDSNLLEAPPKKENKSKIPKGWENEIAKFFAELFKVYVTLNKCCKEEEITQKIKTFLKNLYLITREGRSNYNNEKERDKLFERIVDNMGDVINYLVGNLEFTNKKQQVENIIKEEEVKAQITFTNFDVDPQDIEDSVEEFIETLDGNGKDPYGPDWKYEGNLNPEDIKNRGFNLYGKDAGRLFPKLSLFSGDIKTLFGLLRRGDASGRQQKIKDKYGIYDLSYAVTGSTKTQRMSNLPKITLQFIDDVNFNKDKAFVKFKPEDKVVFNYDKKNKILIHKTSQKKYTNASQVFIEMNTEPKENEVYDSKIIKLIPLKGETFSVEPDYKVKFKILPTGKDSNKEDNK
ncbi:hypothetical protein N9966_00165 [bacterium]|nr:hypothetical protein [bacterium]